MNKMLNHAKLRPLPSAKLTTEMEMVWDIPQSMAHPDLRLMGHEPVATYPYKTAEGALVCYVARYEFDGKKTFRQYTVWAAPDGKKDWFAKGMSGDCPLFGLTDLVARPNSAVIITEGEKCVIAAANLLQDYVCVTYMGGSGAIAKTNFDTLAGRDVIIMPDNDEPGEKAAERLEEKLIEVGAARIRHFNISDLSQTMVAEHCRKGFDIADAIAIGFDAECFKDALENPELITEAPVSHTDLPDDPVLREIQQLFGLEIDLPDGFQMDECGILKTTYNSKGDPEIVFVGSPLVVLGRTYHTGRGWGYHIAIKAPDGIWVQLTLAGKLFASCGKELRELLAEAGFTPPQCIKGRRALSEFISFWSDCPIVEHTTQLGWVGDSFALPEETIHPNGEEASVVLSLSDPNHLVQKKGTFEDWAEIPRLAELSSRPTFAICAAFAAPLLRPLQMKGGGFNFSGQSSRGKTTFLMLAGSVWGGGGETGFTRGWTMTNNGAEAVAAAHNDILLPLDELTKVPPELASEVIMQLSNGQGKARAKVDGTKAPGQQWRVMFISSGERTISHQLELVGGKTHMTGGIDSRCADIGVEVAPGVSFESVAPFESSRELVKRLAKLADTHYGHAGPKFVRYLIDHPAAIDRAASYCKEQQERLISAGDDPQVERVADRFALVGAAGLLAIEAGVLPIKRESVIQAVTRCFEDWKAQRGGNQSAELLAAKRHLKLFFDVHGPSRFESLKMETSETDEIETQRSADYAVRDRCGYSAQTDDGAKVYIVLPEAWRSAVCGTHCPKLMAKIAREAGALTLGEGGRMQKKIRLPDYPNGTRAYILRPDKLD